MALARSIEVMGSGDPRPGTVCVGGGARKAQYRPYSGAQTLIFGKQRTKRTNHRVNRKPH